MSLTDLLLLAATNGAVRRQLLTGLRAALATASDDPDDYALVGPGGPA